MRFSKALNRPDTGFPLGTKHEVTGSKQHEIYMPNVNLTLAYPTQTISYWLALGLALGNYRLVLGIIG